MAWVYLIAAGLLEIVWATALKQSYGFTRLTPTMVMITGMIGSFWLLSLAMRTLPMGTAYTIWTGIGAVGAFTLGILWYEEGVSAMRITAAVLILAGMVLMKLSSSH